MSFKNLEERFNARVNDLYGGYNRKFEDGRPSDGINDDPLLTRRPGDSQLGLRQEGRSVPIVSSARDVKRLTLFTLSQRGLLFVAKQQLLQTGNIFQSTRFINPPFVIGNAIPFLHIRRSFRGTIDDTSVGTLKRIGQLQEETYANLSGGGLTATGLLSKIPVIGKTLSAATSGRSVGDGTYEYKYARPELKENNYFVYKMYLGKKTDKNSILSTIGKFSNFLKRFGIGRGTRAPAPSPFPSPLSGPLNYYGAVNTDGTYTTYLLETDGKKEEFYASRENTDYSNFLLASYRMSEAREPIRSGLLTEFTNELGTETQYSGSIIKKYIDKQTESPYGVNTTGAQVSGSDYKRSALNGLNKTTTENNETLRSGLLSGSTDLLTIKYNTELDIKSAITEATGSPYGVSSTGARVSGSDYKRDALDGLWATTDQEPRDGVRSDLLNESNNLLISESLRDKINSALTEATGAPYGENNLGPQVLGSDYKRDKLDGLWAKADQQPQDGIRTDLLNELSNSLIDKKLRDRINSAITEATGSPYGVSETGASVSGSDYKRTKLNGSWITSNQEPQDDIRTVLLRDSARKLSDSYGKSDRSSDLLNKINNYQSYVDEEFNRETGGNIASQPFIKYFTPDDTQAILSRGGGTNAAALRRAAGGRKIKYLKDPLNEPYEGVNILDRYKNLRTLDSEGGESTEDIITVSFAMGNNNHVQFRAFIRDLDQSMSPEYKPYQYIGRIEKFIYYLSVERSVNFKLDILAFSKDELDVVWNRINYMTSLVFPYGVNRGILQPNIVRMTIGNVYVDQPAYVTNMSVNFNEVVESWDIDREVPIGATISLSMNLIEKNTKTANEAFYGINESPTVVGVDNQPDFPYQLTPIPPDVPDNQSPPPQIQPDRNFSPLNLETPSSVNV